MHKNLEKYDFVHESSYIDDNVEIGEGTKIWHFCHIMSNVKIGKNCVIGSNCTLGPNVIIGDNVKIGANSVVVNDVPPNSVVVGVPGKIVSKKDDKVEKIDLRHGDLPDPLAITISRLDKRIRELEKILIDANDQNKETNEKFNGEYGEGI